MKNPRFFLPILLIVAFFLFLVDFPIPIKLSNTKFPIIGKKVNFNFDSSRLNLNLGLVKLQRDTSYRLGLDLEGGARLMYQIDMKDVAQNQREDAFAGVRSVIERRVNLFGVAEPTIQSLKVGNNYRIVVELPGTTDVEQAQALIGSTAQMSFWEEGKDKIATEEAYLYPYGITAFFGLNKPIKTQLTGKDLKSATVVFGQKGDPQVQLNFSGRGTQLFADITKRNVGKPVAIVIDNQVITSPVVQQAIVQGNAVISGNFTTESANNLKIQLNSGALPAPLQLISQSTVGPSLGIESLKKSLVGGIIGFLSVVIFMTVLYKKEGALASFALVVYTITILFLFKVIPITLTLGGIAGLILSIGMAVDANILIFERMKEELRLQKPREVAVRLGFSRAWPSIRDSNISSLITTFILFSFGSGPVRGFAVALGIGILVSMFSAIVVTQNLLRFFEHEK